MSICDNSLLISFNSRIQIRVHFTRFEHCQVSICDNRLAKTFIFGFLELFYFSSTYEPSALSPEFSALSPQASALNPQPAALSPPISSLIPHLPAYSPQAPGLRRQAS